ncbi:MAG TPA: MarR family transcriptional regulator [Streptosporangiaceae bacterium]|jgi:DNA-binding MarR family transcriptional regulator
MSSVRSAGDAGRRRRRLANQVKDELRELATQLSLHGRAVGARVDFRDVDLDCLDLIARHGPISPSALARRAGLHPATMTGVLDRLERGGWIARERDGADRRAVTVRALRDRNAELYEHFSGMNNRMDTILDDYSDADLELIAGFLNRTTAAGHEATGDLAE